MPPDVGARSLRSPESEPLGEKRPEGPSRPQKEITASREVKLLLSHNSLSIPSLKVGFVVLPRVPPIHPCCNALYSLEQCMSRS